MFMQIITHTPTWVFCLLAGLVALGISSLYGLLSGVFLGRSLRLLQLMRGKAVGIPSSASSLTSPSV